MVSLSVTNLSGLAACDAKQFVVARREDVVLVPTGRPHLVVPRERDVDDGAQWLRVTHWRNAAHGFCNSWGDLRAAHRVGCGGTLVGVKDTAAVKHWASARDLVGSDPPTSDDLPTTLAGEPLDSADKVRQFLANLDRARLA